MCLKGYDGIVAFSLGIFPLDVQQLRLIIIFLGESGVLNQLEDVVPNEMFIHGEDGFGTWVRGLEDQ